jgi:hypothetical protein
MGKLLQRLKDPSRSGVYRVSRTDEVLDAARGGSPRVSRVSLAGALDKNELLARLARGLQFPAWFGANWDALEDCLTDMSWLEADGHVLLLEGASGLPADDFGVLADVLSSSARYWAGRGRSFFAVFVQGPESLPPLIREKSA